MNFSVLFSFLLLLMIVGIVVAILVVLGMFVSRQFGDRAKRSNQDTEDAETIRDLERLVTALSRRIDSLETLVLDEYNSRSRRRSHEDERG